MDGPEFLSNVARGHAQRARRLETENHFLRVALKQIARELAGSRSKRYLAIGEIAQRALDNYGGQREGDEG